MGKTFNRAKIKAAPSLEKKYCRNFRRGNRHGIRVYKAWLIILTWGLVITGSAMMAFIGFGSGFIYKRNKGGLR